MKPEELMSWMAGVREQGADSVLVFDSVRGGKRAEVALASFLASDATVESVGAACIRSLALRKKNVGTFHLEARKLDEVIARTTMQVVDDQEFDDPDPTNLANICRILQQQNERVMTWAMGMVDHANRRQEKFDASMVSRDEKHEAALGTLLATAFEVSEMKLAQQREERKSQERSQHIARGWEEIGSIGRVIAGNVAKSEVSARLVQFLRTVQPDQWKGMVEKGVLTQVQLQELAAIVDAMHQQESEAKAKDAKPEGAADGKQA